MSHIVEIRTEVRDEAAVQLACRRRNLPAPVHGDFKLFTKQATGLGVRLKEWRYPVVIDLPTGQLSYDNYQGKWGNPIELNGFLQAYAVEKASLEARKLGHAVVEKSLDDGSIRLSVMVGGAAQ